MIDSSGADHAFLDIAANMLAIILMITMFSLVTIHYQTRRDLDPDAVRDPDMPFSTPRRDLFPPFSRFFFVAADRVVAWDQAAVLEALANEPNRLSEQLGQGRYQWFAEPLVARDIDTFRMNFFPDTGALAEAAESFTETNRDALLAEIRERYLSSRTAPVFIVYPSGMEVFAELYPQLTDAGVPFRWFPRVEGAPLYLGRTPNQFTDYGIYW